MNAIPAGAPAKAEAAPLIAWMEENSADLCLSVVSVAEIVGGIAKLRREGAVRKARALETWLDTVLHLYGERALPFGIEAACVAGALTDLAGDRGHAPGLADTMIAASAAVHGLTIPTRNVRHLAPFDVPLLDPFESLPPGRA